MGHKSAFTLHLPSMWLQPSLFSEEIETILLIQEVPAQERYKYRNPYFFVFNQCEQCQMSYATSILVSNLPTMLNYGMAG